MKVPESERAQLYIRYQVPIDEKDDLVVAARSEEARAYLRKVIKNDDRFIGSGVLWARGECIAVDVDDRLYHKDREGYKAAAQKIFDTMVAENHSFTEGLERGSEPGKAPKVTYAGPGRSIAGGNPGQGE